MFTRHGMTLRALLTIPYLGLVLGLAAVIGALSYASGREAVNTLSAKLLTDTVLRIEQAIAKHVSGSEAVLEAAFPTGMTAPPDIESDLPQLRTRFWLATSVHRDPNNYAYFGDRHGRFFGLWRHSASEAELRLRLKGEGARAIRRFEGINGALGAPTIESRVYDPRERLWFKAGQSQANAWTAVYIDFKTEELVCTRAKRVLGTEGQFEGVVATDLSLLQINQFLQKLSISQRGLAMVVEPNGDLIGVSRGPNLKPGAEGRPARLNAAESADALVRATYARTQELLARNGPGGPRTATLTDEQGEAVEMGFARIRDDAGLDWIVMVAVPRDDFLHSITQNFYITLAVALIFAAGTTVIGLSVLSTVRQQLLKFAEAARRIGDGDMSTPLAVERRDELGELARSFATMQTRLLTDTLTGLANRDALLRRIEERVSHQRRRQDARPFALFFIDLNEFKAINDRLGHDVGDRVLKEVSQRLQDTVRQQDLVARYAGDEFVVLIDSVDSRREAETLRDQLRRVLAQPLLALADIDDAPENAGGAVGLALFPDDGQDCDTLLKRADADMYVEKTRY